MHEVRLGICGGLSKIHVFWDVIMYHWVSTSSCFEGLYCFILKQFKKRHCPWIAWHVVLHLEAIQEETLFLDCWALWCFILKQFKKRHCFWIAWHYSASP